MSPADLPRRRALLLSALAFGGGSAALEAMLPAAAQTLAVPKDAGPEPPAGRSGTTPEEHGADGTPGGDRAGLCAALATDAAAVDLAPRLYRLDAAALARLALTGKTLRGVRGRSLIQLVEAPVAEMLSVTGQRDFAIRDIAFDGGGLLERRGRGGYPIFRPCVLVESCQRFAITGCSFTGFETAGLLLNVSSDALIAENRAYRTRPASTPNYGIAVLGGGRRVTLHDNVAANCNIAVDVSDSAITGNDVSGWGFSAGINVAEDTRNARDLLIAFNRCCESASVPDRDGFYLDGIECWAPGSLVVANRCRGSIGNGISFGADDMIVAANQCHSNGSLVEGRVVGWGIRALADRTDASRSLVIANRCGDDRPAALKRQAFGYGENSDRLADIELWANSFSGNAVTALDIHSLSTRIDGLQTGRFVPRGGIAFAEATGTFVIGSGTTRISMEVVVPPTRDVSPFSIDNLPSAASAWGLLTAASLRADIRLTVAPGSHRAAADRVSYADLAGVKLLIAGEYISENN